MKRNNAKLCEEIKSRVHDENTQKTMETSGTIEKNGGRVERRTAYVSHDVKELKNARKWVGLSCFGAIRRQIEINGKTTDEWHYYISSRKLSSDDFLKRVRYEWGIESMH